MNPALEHELNQAKILIVDDRKENLIALDALLQSLNVEILQANSGNEALAKVLDHEFALVLLDVQMPEMDGFEVAELMRINPSTQRIPIIFVTAISKEEEYHFKGYQLGAVDYLNKPINPDILKAKVKVFIELWQQREDLRQANQELEKAYLRIKQQEQELREMAIHDHLTGLYQRRWFDELLSKEYIKTRRNKQPCSLAILDIDHFKRVNDTYGHQSGDKVLIDIAKAMQENVRASDHACRYGGEEFAIIMPETHSETAVGIAERLRSVIGQLTFHLNETVLTVTISIGIVTIGGAVDCSVEDMVQKADTFLYQAKDEGRNRVRFGVIDS